jgi:hypothetical protein
MKIAYVKKKQSINPYVHARILRNSKRVRFLRVVIPASVMAALTGVMVYYGHYTTFTPQDISTSPYAKINVSNQLVNATLVSQDNQGRLVTIHSKTASQQEDKAILEAPQSSMRLDNGDIVTVTSKTAHYDDVKKTLDYQKNVVLTTQDGMILATEHAALDINKKTASGESPLQGSSALGKISSEKGFEWHENTLSLKGKSTLILK